MVYDTDLLFVTLVKREVGITFDGSPYLYKQLVEFGLLHSFISVLVLHGKDLCLDMFRNVTISASWLVPEISDLSDAKQLAFSPLPRERVGSLHVFPLSQAQTCIFYSSFLLFPE